MTDLNIDWHGDRRRLIEELCFKIWSWRTKSKIKNVKRQLWRYPTVANPLLLMMSSGIWPIKNPQLKQMLITLWSRTVKKCTFSTKTTRHLIQYLPMTSLSLSLYCQPVQPRTSRTSEFYSRRISALERTSSWQGFTSPVSGEDKENSRCILRA